LVDAERVGRAAARMGDVLEVRLQREAGLDFVLKVLVCTHATFRFAVDKFGVEKCPAASPSNTPPISVKLSVRSALSRDPMAASGGEGPPLGMSTEKPAGQPKDALLKTSMYFAVMNSVRYHADRIFCTCRQAGSHYGFPIGIA
jgi:hypothetical protein